MIRSFKSKDTERLYGGGLIKRFEQFARSAERKLRIIDDAHQLNDLRVPPNNRLEALKGIRKGQFSIRINDQFRICFVWRNGDAHDVEIVDYH
jgi:proteic killer suppression protein